jgi:hypothetical protein
MTPSRRYTQQMAQPRKSGTSGRAGGGGGGGGGGGESLPSTHCEKCTAGLTNAASATSKTSKGGALNPKKETERRPGERGLLELQLASPFIIGVMDDPLLAMAPGALLLVALGPSLTPTTASVVVVAKAAPMLGSLWLSVALEHASSR